jgi:hypothetical protein
MDSAGFYLHRLLYEGAVKAAGETIEASSAREETDS